MRGQLHSIPFGRIGYWLNGHVVTVTSTVKPDACGRDVVHIERMKVQAPSGKIVTVNCSPLENIRPIDDDDRRKVSWDDCVFRPRKETA